MDNDELSNRIMKKVFQCRRNIEDHNYLVNQSWLHNRNTLEKQGCACGSKKWENLVDRSEKVWVTPCTHSQFSRYRINGRRKNKWRQIEEDNPFQGVLCCVKVIWSPETRTKKMLSFNKKVWRSDNRCDHMRQDEWEWNLLVFWWQMKEEIAKRKPRPKGHPDDRESMKSIKMTGKNVKKEWKDSDNKCEKNVQVLGSELCKVTWLDQMEAKKRLYSWAVGRGQSINSIAKFVKQMNTKDLSKMDDGQFTALSRILW